MQEKVDTDNGRTDTWGDGCSWYVTNTGNCGVFDDDDFEANVMCAACGGGEVPRYDIAGDGCSWYEGRPGECGKWDDEDFHAHADCWQCANAECDPVVEAAKEGRDSGNDDCSWYIGRESSCGVWDSADFVASELCCACSNQTAPAAVTLSGLQGLSKAKMAVVLAQGSKPMTPVLNLA